MLPKSCLRFILTGDISEAELMPDCLAHTGTEQTQPNADGNFGLAPADIVICRQGCR